MNDAGASGHARLGGSLALALAMACALVAATVTAGTRQSGPDALSTQDPAGLGPLEAMHAVTGRVAVSPVTVALDVTARRGHHDATTQARATITNLGATSIERVVVVLRASPDAVSIRPDREQVIRRLAAASGSTLTWTVCGRSPGSYELTARITIGGATLVSPPRVLIVVAETVC